MKLALLVSNRGFFPSAVIEAAYADMRLAAERAGVELLEIEQDKVRFGAVETTQEGAVYFEFLRARRGEYDGVILCLPNFGDENGIKAALRGIDVPLLLQAYPDEIGRMDFDHRRDAFCGKLGLCAVFKQMGMKFTTGKPFVMHPLSGEFARELSGFVSVCRAVKRLRHARLGVFGARTTAFKSVRYDEAAMERLGCDVESIDLSQVFARFDEIDPRGPEAARFADEIRRTGNCGAVPEQAVNNLAVLGATLQAFVGEMQLDAMAVRCWMELEHQYKIAPCALLGLFNSMGVPAACETDATNALAMLALSAASGQPAGCLDINNNYGDAPDKAVLFHCGPLPIELMTGPGDIQEHKMFVKTLGPDCSWGVNVGRIKPGVITIAGMRTENGQVRYFAERAEITEDVVEPAFFGTPGVMEMPGLQDKLFAMAEEGFRHHAIITPGDNADVVVEALSKYLGYTRVCL